MRENMATPNFEEGSLEYKLVVGLVNYHNETLKNLSFDIYRTFGLIVKAEVTVNYQVEGIRNLADYIRQAQEKGEYNFEMLEYWPTAFDVDGR